MARVFISHATADSASAAAVKGWLHADGHDVFLDRDALLPGEAWKQRLYTELRSADAVVCLISPAFVTSVWCAAETGIADSLGCLLLPLRIAGSSPHPLIESAQYVDYQADPAGARQKMLDQLRRLNARGRYDWVEGQNPFPGLAAFTAAFASMFFGRERDTLRLADQLRASVTGGSGVVAVSGPSGCGKSSLLAAGLIPQLQADGSWLAPAPFTPAQDPIAGLVRRLTELGRRYGRDWSPATVRTILDRADTGLAELAEDLLTTDVGSEHRRLLLTIDQGEELFTRADPTGVNRFAWLVRAAVTGPVRLVIGLRSEYLDDLRVLPALTGVELGSFVLGSLNRDMLALAITEPARIAGLHLEPALLPTLVTDTRRGEALPLLAFTLHALAEGKHRGDTLTVAAYHGLGGVDGKAGGVDGVLTRHAEQALAQATAVSGLTHAAVLSCLTRLADVDDTGRRTRRRIRQDTLSPAQREAIAVFVAARLLTSDGDETGTVWITPVHEALLTAWPPLHTALSERVAARAAQRSLEQAAADWEAAGRPAAAYLWDHDRLSATLTTLTDGADNPNDALMDLSAPARGFLDATHRHLDALRRREQEEHRRVARRQKIIFVGIAVVLVLSLTASLTLWQWRAATAARRDAEHARAVAASIGMATAADAVRATDPGTAMALGAAAYKLNPGPVTAPSLVNTLIDTAYAGTLTGHIGRVLSMVFSPDGHTLATSGEDNTVILWDMTDRARPTRLSQFLTGHTGWGAWAVFSPDGRTLATTSSNDDHTVILWDVGNRARPTRLSQFLTGHTGWGVQAVFSPDERTLATTSEDHTVILWDITDRARPTRLSQFLTGHTGWGVQAVFSPDERTLATTSEDGIVILWDMTDRTRPIQLGQPLTGRTGWGVQAVFSPDGRTLATSGEDRTVILWDMTDRTQPTRLGQPLTGPGGVLSVVFSPDGRTLTTANNDKTVILWDIADRALPTFLLSQPLIGHDNDAIAVVFSPDRRTLAAASGYDGTVILWEVGNRTQPTRLGQPLTVTGGPGNRVLSVAFSPDGRTLAAAGGNDGTVILWDMTDRTRPIQLGQPLTGHTGGVFSVAFSPDERTLAAAGGNDGTVILWDMTDRTRPTRLGQPITGPGGVLSVVFSPDGRTLAAAGDNHTAILWDMTDRTRPTRLGQPITAHKGTVASVAFSPDGRTLATASEDRTVILWDMTDRTRPIQLGQPLTGHADWVLSVAFSSDGRTLATASGNDGTVILWDMTDRTRPTRMGQPLTNPHGVLSMAFASDGRTLAIGSGHGGDYTVILWDVANRARPSRLGQPLTAASGPVFSVAFAPDRHTLATSAGDDSTVILWDLTAFNALRANPLPAACARGGNSITQQMWDLYAPGIPYQHPCGA